MIRTGFRLAPLSVTLALAGLVTATAVAQDPAHVIAIGILLEPDAEMTRFAEAANKGVRRAYPAGFTLDAGQVPHIALVHSFVRAGDLPKLEAQVAAVLAADNPLLIQLTALGYDHSQREGLALMRIDVERSDSLTRVQTKLIEAIKPFAVAEGSADAFAVSRDLPRADQAMVAGVQNFAADATGRNFKPHITIGLAQHSIAKDIEAIRFPHRTFRATSAAIYQLGNYGVAQEKIWSWKTGQRVDPNL